MKLHCLAFTPARAADGTARVPPAHRRGALRHAADRRRAGLLRAPRPGHGHGAGDPRGLPGVRRLRPQGGEPLPGARPRDGTRARRRRDPAADRQRDGAGRRIALDRRARGPPGRP